MTNTTTRVLASQTQSESGDAAPTDAAYVTLGANATLTQERVLTPEASVLTLVDGGANNPVTVGVAAGGIGTAKLADDAVTYAKIQNVSAASRLLGRGSAGGAGDPEELTISTGLALTGTVLTATAAAAITQLTGNVTAGPGSGSQAATIANDAVTYAKMQNVAAASRLLGRGSAAGAGDPEEITVSTGLTMTGAVLTAPVSAITQLTGDVTAGPGANSQAATVAANAVTYAKMQDVSAASRLLGRGSAAGAGDPQELTVGSGLSLTSTTLTAVPTGWTDDGANVRLNTAADTVSIGTATPASGMKLTIVGNIGPEADATRFLGSSTLRFQQLWAAIINIGVGVGNPNLGYLNTGSESDNYHQVTDIAATASAPRRLIVTRRSRGTLAAKTAVATGDLIGDWDFQADMNGSASYASMVTIRSVVESRTGATACGGQLLFYTRGNAAAGPWDLTLMLSANGNVVVGNQVANALGAVDGFLHIPTCAGVPTGVPNLYTGSVPMVYDTTNFRLYVYAGGAWRIH